MLFKREEDTETESEYSDYYSSCNESDTDFLQSDSSENTEEEKNKMKWIAQLSLCSGHH